MADNTSREAMTPFAQMAEARRESLADKIANEVSDFLGAAGLRVDASGGGVQVYRDAQYTPGGVVYSSYGGPLQNPLVLAAIVLGIVVLLRD